MKINSLSEYFIESWWKSKLLRVCMYNVIILKYVIRPNILQKYFRIIYFYFAFIYIFLIYILFIFIF